MIEIKVSGDHCSVMLDGHGSKCLEELVVGILSTVMSLSTGNGREKDKDKIDERIAYTVEYILSKLIENTPRISNELIENVVSNSGEVTEVTKDNSGNVFDALDEALERAISDDIWEHESGCCGDYDGEET